MNQTEYYIFKNKAFLGSIIMPSKGSSFAASTEELRSVLEDPIKNGALFSRKTVRDGNTIIESKIIQSHEPQFAQAVISWLKSHGYRVVREEKDITDQIQAMLKNIPDHDPTKQKMLGVLKSGSYLEKTLLLQILQKGVTA
jgi:hypothetical protein